MFHLFEDGHATKLALDWVEDLLADGSMIYFDDIYFYSGNPNKGELKAITDFNDARTSSGLQVAPLLDPFHRVYFYWRNTTDSQNLQF